MSYLQSTSDGRALTAANTLATLTVNLVTSGCLPPVKNGDGLMNVVYDEATNRITNNGYEYDVMGNLVRGLSPDGSQWYRYEYDTANRLRIVKTDAGANLQVMGYGAGRERLYAEDWTRGFATLYAGGLEYRVTDWATQTNGLTWTKSSVYLGSRLLSTMTPAAGGAERIEYHHPNRLGTQLITNPQDGTFYEQTTLPYGNVLANETSGTTNQPFTSYDRNSVTSLDYAQNRMYDSGAGRFTSVDPIGMSAASLGNPQSLNLYAYTENDPINSVDPSGLFLAAPNTHYWSGDEIGVVTIYSGYDDERLSDFLSFVARSEANLRQIDYLIVRNEWSGGTVDREEAPMINYTPTNGEDGPSYAGQACDNTLASTFGGKGAVVGSKSDPDTLARFDRYRGRILYTNQRAPGHGPVPMTPTKEFPEDAGGIIHIYGDAKGLTRDTGLYAPAGGSVSGISITGKGNAVMRVTYSGKNPLAGMTISFTHVTASNMSDSNDAKSIRIGNIGGRGDGDEYVHTHIVFFSNGKRIDPRKVFCKVICKNQDLSIQTANLGQGLSDTFPMLLKFN